MKELVAGRKVKANPSWDKAMLAEEQAWVFACKKMRVTATRAKPDDRAGQEDTFTSLRQQTLAYYWRSPSTGGAA
jgi:hypothetical protein